MPYQIKNGIIYSGNAVTLTQAQYDALTTAEKNNGTVYYIYDSDAMIEAQEVGLDGGNVEDLAGSVATIETSPATANHEVGEYILWNGVLYTVTSAIATGENLVVNSNISVRTLGSELTALNNGLTRNKKGTTVNLSNSTTDYTFPSDGYLMVSAGSSSNAVAIVDLRDSTSSYIGTVGGQGNSNYPSWATFVRAGMIVRIRTVSNSGYVAFVPLVS